MPRWTAADYDSISQTYDERYRHNALEGVVAALVALVKTLRPRRILEVGCGTGHWLSLLSPQCEMACGVDPSPGMLFKAREKGPSLSLVLGRDTQIAFASASFELVFCVNAIHQFNDPRGFISRAADLLREGGVLALIGMDPHGGAANWVYDNFAGTRERDIRRFPRWDDLQRWMEAAGFADLQLQEVHRVQEERVGRELLGSPFLAKNGCSQLASLDQEAYQAGLDRIHEAIAAGERAGTPPVFRVDIPLFMLCGTRR